MNAEASRIIAALGLEPLAREGGYFRRTWQAAPRSAGDRPAGSAIYYLLTADDVSALHVLDADEIWHFYAGDVVEHVQFDPCEAQPTIQRLGEYIVEGQRPQVHVRAGVWQGARLLAGAVRGWALVGCTVVPAWEERGFELIAAGAVLQRFPAHAALVQALAAGRT